MPNATLAPIARATFTLAIIAALAIGLAANSAPALLAGACAACAAPFLKLRARRHVEPSAEQREHARLAQLDREIVAVVRRHTALLERRRAQLVVIDRREAETKWERDLARFQRKFVQPAITALRDAETDDDILCRLRLVVDEILASRARIARHSVLRAA